MSSRKGVEKPFVAGTAQSSSSSPQVDQLTNVVADVSLNGGEWEVYTTRKSKNRASGGGGAGKPCPSTSSGDKVWGHLAAAQQKGGVQISGSAKFPPGTKWPAPGAGSRRPPPGRGNISSPQSTAGRPSPQAIPLPLEHGWSWSTRAAANGQSSQDATRQRENTILLHPPPPVDDDNDNDDLDEVDTDDELFNEDYDSDVSEKSHDARKDSKWFKDFFANLDKISSDDVHNPSRQWHCPACKGGPGAIDWYRGLQPLMTHARTRASMRVKLHREFAELLDEELRRKGILVTPVCGTFGKWQGLDDEKVKDRSIVWPPMVVIMNTRHEQDENNQWIGMGNQELLESFGSYAAVKARHAYGPQGHRGMSVLIFENSAMGFLEAERLHNHFQEQRTDRDAWDRCPALFYPGGKRLLYGYMAEKQDLDLFNRHCHGDKAALKFETRSYQEMVVDQLRQMSEDNQQLIWFKEKVAKEQRRSKALEESFQIVSEKLRRTMEENRIVKQRSKMHHQQSKEEMDTLEEFFKQQLEIINKTMDAKEDEFELIQQEERKKKKQSNDSAHGDHSHREEDFAKFVQSQEKQMEDFVSERDKLEKACTDKEISIEKRYIEERIQLKKDFDAVVSQLMIKYGPQRLEEEGNSSEQ